MDTRNSDTLKEMREAFGVQTATDKTVSPIPVVDVNPKNLRRANIASGTSSAATGNFTVYTTPSDKDFFLTGVQMQYMKDATADNTTVAITATEDSGATITLITTRTITTTAYTAAINRELVPPIKLKRNSNVIMSGTFTVGALTRAACVSGYTVEVQN